MARKILLADDSVTAQNMGRRILSEAGYEVVTVNNGSAALKKIAEQPPDIIILDVYMPGYSGVEVCQRIKEAAETAHIPVLLTVGKLEPFKADEARRVHADAHLVKPFEASELLTALTKLEDKIVPLPEAKPRGRFGKTVVVEQSATPAKGTKFGDSETGWKNRLTIPSSTPKPQEPEEAPQTAATAFRDFARGEDFKPQAPSSFTGPVLETLPQDITADEIAAIAAAAAAFGNKTELAGPELAEEIAAAEAAAASFIPAPEMTEESAPMVVSETSAPEADAAEIRSSDTVASEAEMQPPAEPEAAAAETTVESAALPAVSISEPEAESESEAHGERAALEVSRDADVVAALESLAPVTMAAAAESAGPRWMAQEIPVGEGEAALILEYEMQKAYAAMSEAGVSGFSFAASAAGTATGGNGDYSHATVAETSHDGSFSSEASEAKPEEFDPAAATVEDAVAVASAGPEAAASEMGADASASQPVPAAEQATPEAAFVADSYETAPSYEGEAVSAIAAAVSASSTSESESMPEVAEPAAAGSETVVAETKIIEPTESAYAAAASAGTAFRSISPVAAVSQVAPPAESTESITSAAPAPPSGERETELAAAWAHWRQIRESIASPQFTSQVADAAVASFNENQPQPSAPASPEPDAAPAGTATDSSSIASIVESVLAELRPKLVEEIARKLSKEKEKK